MPLNEFISDRDELVQHIIQREHPVIVAEFEYRLIAEKPEALNQIAQILRDCREAHPELVSAQDKKILNDTLQRSNS